MSAGTIVTDEGELTFRGATGELDPADGPFAVVDIGGGSTEFMAGRGDGGKISLDGVLSLDVGCVRITEQYIETDPPRPEELSAAISVVDAFIDDVLRDLPGVGEAATVVGVAGTITTAAAVELGLLTYDRAKVHHFRLSRDAAEDVFRTLATENREDRAHNPGLEKARVDVIVGGLCVLVAIYRKLGLDEILVSEADILDGALLSLREAE
jgi:exopolyphosphatase / guanosine-5'-triphosphate,3'-diphosphate pyrophosphatase